MGEKRGSARGRFCARRKLCTLTRLFWAEGMKGTAEKSLCDIDDSVASAVDYLKRSAPDFVVALVVDWLLHLRIARGLTVTTIASYCKSIAQFLIWMRSKALVLSEITATDIDDWQKYEFIQKRLSPRTRRKNLVIVRRFYEWLAQYHGYNNPALNTPPPKINKLVPKKFETRELLKLFESCNRETPLGVRDYSMLLFFYATGARREEVQSLSMSQLNIQTKIGRVRFFGKGAKERMVTFGAEVVDALRQWFVTREQVGVIDNDAVWVGVGPRQKGLRMSVKGVDEMLRRRVEKLKLPPKGLHALRVSFATDMYDAGEQIEVIQQLMGHENIETTRRYIVVSERRQRAKMPGSRLNEITGGKTSEQPLWIQEKLQNAGMFERG